MTGSMRTRVDPQEMEDWTEEEVDHYLLGPFAGEIPGLIRRLRRILDVSQRGLAAILGVSQSQVARWETRRTSPRAAMLVELLRMARLRVELHDTETGEVVEPMRDDGARDRARRRYPAHVDLVVTGWWMPRDVMMTTQAPRWRARSRRWGVPRVSYRLGGWKHVLRHARGTPDDHPAHHQLLAEAWFLDEMKEERRRRATAHWPRRPTGPPRPHGGLSA